MLCIKKIKHSKNSLQLYFFPIRKQFNKAWKELDLNIFAVEDLKTLEKNNIIRNHENNIPLILSLFKEYQMATDNKQYLQNQLKVEFLKLPNRTHPRILNYGNKPKELMIYKTMKNSTSRTEEFSEICKRFNLLRMEHLGNFTGHKSYYLMGFLAEMEQALIQYALEKLKSYNFRLIAVPDILSSNVIEGCGMQTDGSRTQVYKLDSGKCLSGTSEMALAGYFQNSLFEASDLPITVAAVSRCHRAETSGLQEEKGIYRVHQFSKVEMFSICSEEQSENILEKFKDIEIELFMNLELSFRLLDMPPRELGSPAYRKYDIEAWMPGRKMWGEISSCSNCTDYQAKRLNIKYRSDADEVKYVHTINGTAAAIPRLLLALIEENQNENDVITLPNALKSYMKTKELKYKTQLPELKLLKFIKLQN